MKYGWKEAAHVLRYFHMLVNTKEMSGVTVVTRSGQTVGKVTSFDLDSATGRMMRLHVKTGGIVTGLLRNELYVAASSVIQMSRESIVVADAAVTEEWHVLAQGMNPISSVPGVFGRE